MKVLLGGVEVRSVFFCFVSRISDQITRHPIQKAIKYNLESASRARFCRFQMWMSATFSRTPNSKRE